LAWPWDGSLWKENLAPAQTSFVALCRAIADVGGGAEPAQALEVLVPDAEHEQAAQAALSGLPVRFHRIPVGDIWLRDTAPIFLKGPKGIATARFGFNGWGGKYVLEHDAEVAPAIAQEAGLPQFSYPWVLEGGSIEVDGEGTVLTTRQCLLNPNRNPGANQPQISAWLREALGVQRVLWLDEGLLNDHTDGHIDTLARFVAPGAVVCMQATTEDDPNKDVLEEIAEGLAKMSDAKGRRLKVHRIPSPGRVVDEEDRVMPASYVNYYVANRTVVVPLYGTVQDTAALAALTPLFPGRRTIGVPAQAILSGGGAFHCITQQEPR
jgi:agmatine deiminase